MDLTTGRIAINRHSPPSQPNTSHRLGNNMAFTYDEINALERDAREASAALWNAQDMVLASAYLQLANAARGLTDILQQRRRAPSRGHEYASRKTSDQKVRRD